jgi:protease-4
VGIPGFEADAYAFIAEVGDATAAFINPAALAGGQGTNLYLDLSGNDDEIMEGVVALQGGSWAFCYRHRDLLPRGTEPTALNGFGIPDGEGNIDTYILSSSWGPPRLQLGASKVWTNTDLPGEDASGWRVGLRSRPQRRLSLGVVVDNVSRTSFLDGKLVPRYRYGISVRPLSWNPELLTVSVEGSHYDGHPEAIDMAYGVRLHLNSGLEFGVSVQDPNGEGPRFGGWLAAYFGKGAAAAHARGVHGKETYRSTVSLQVFDQFWQRSMTPKKSLATVELDGIYEDEGSGFVLLGADTKGARNLVRRIDDAAEDDAVRGLVLRLGNVRGAFLGPIRAQHEELHRALTAFRESGKPVVAYLDGISGASEVYLASAADRIVMPPLGGIQGIGVSFHQRRYKGMWDRIGVGWNADTSGVYKSTFHSMYTDSASAPQAAEIQGLVDGVYDHLISTLQAARGISDADMAVIGTGRPLFSDDCVRMKLVDEEGWWDDALKAADRLAGGAGEAQPAAIPLPDRAYWTERWTPPPAVGVVPAYGDIESGSSRQDWIRGGRTMGSRTVIRQLRAAAGYPGVKAIVFRIDSGGGSALASEEIRRQILELKGKVPLYVSMGGMAASGGYWIAMDGDSVFADATTLTGSIGVLWAMPVIAGLYEKLGVTNETYKRGEHTDMLQPYRKITPEEAAMLNASLDRVYGRFVDGVAQGRGLPEDRVRELAQGRVYLGSEAAELGLVDGIGGLEEVVERAAAAAGIADDYRVLTFTPARPGLLKRGLGYLGVFASGVLGSGGPGGDETISVR